jgi:hypothetical protein
MDMQLQPQQPDEAKLMAFTALMLMPKKNRHVRRFAMRNFLDE